MSTPAQPLQAAAAKWAVQAPDGKVIQFPDNFSDADVTREMTKMYPQGQDQNQSTVKAQPAMFSKQWFKDKGFQAADAVSEALPGLGASTGAMLGGTAGSSVGPLGTAGGGVSGAMLGGMAGNAGKQLLQRALGIPSPQSSGEAANQIGKEGLVQGAVQLPAEGLPFLAGPMKQAAVSQYERALAPTTKINKAITQDITPELIQRGERGSLEGLQNRAGQQLTQLNPELNAAYQNMSTNRTSTGIPSIFPFQKKVAGAGDQVVSDLEALKQSYMPGGNIAQPQAVNAIEGMQNIVKQYGSDISPDNLRRLRQIFEEAPAQRGAYAGTDLSTNYTLNAQQQAADSIRGILNKNPDVGALNKEISFWLDVQRVTSQSGLRRTGQEGGLLRYLGPLGSALAGAGTGFGTHSAEAGLGAAAATTLATSAATIARSPWWRTSSAVAKDRVANALARGDVGAISALLSRLGLAATGPMTQGTQTDSSAIPQSK